jgi:hypothetical protein
MWLAKFCGEISLIGWLIKCGKDTVASSGGQKDRQGFSDGKCGKGTS